jgi:hypothetical protein
VASGLVQGADGEVPEGSYRPGPGSGADGGFVLPVERVTDQCRDSIAHWPRTREAMVSGSARVASRLVTPSAATSDSGLPSRAVTCRSIRYTWLTCGNGKSLARS